MTDQKRKRRTFWEPESPAVQEWLANQKDLGMSLQLIIVDAINAYGSGDVIQTHLSNRMNGQAPAPTPTVDTLVQQAVQQAPQQLAPQAPRPPAPQVTQAQAQAQPTPVQQASFTPEPAPQPQRKPVAPQANDVDPVAVMFGDLGSQQR